MIDFIETGLYRFLYSYLVGSKNQKKKKIEEKSRGGTLLIDFSNLLETSLES